MIPMPSQEQRLSSLRVLVESIDSQFGRGGVDPDRLRKLCFFLVRNLYPPVEVHSSVEEGIWLKARLAQDEIENDVAIELVLAEEIEERLARELHDLAADIRCCPAALGGKRDGKEEKPKKKKKEITDMDGGQNRGGGQAGPAGGVPGAEQVDVAGDGGQNGGGGQAGPADGVPAAEHVDVAGVWRRSLTT